MSESTQFKKMAASPARLEARITEQQKLLFQYAASLVGRTLTDFVVNSLQEAAARVIQEHEVIKLSMRDSETFVSTLLNPPEPSEPLLKAMSRYKKAVAY